MQSNTLYECPWPRFPLFLFLASVGVHVHLASASSFFCALAYTFLLPPLNLHSVEGSQDGANKAENSPSLHMCLDTAVGD